MSEAEFLRVIDTLKLSYQVSADRATDGPIPKPFWRSGNQGNQIELDAIQKVYGIDGEKDYTHQSREGYRAYVDRNGFVVYLENAYQYSSL